MLTTAAGLTAATLVGGLTAGADPASARSRTPVLTGIRCVPATSASCAGGVSVTTGRLLQLSGRRLRSGMRVTFRWPTGALATKLRHTRTGYTARVPAGTRAGSVSVTVTDRAGRRSRARRIRVVASGPTPVTLPVVAGLPAQFAGHGMWIWQLAKTEGSDVAAIAQKAVASGFQTVFVKAADGQDTWAQFTPQLVAQLKAAGLRVCAWQFVYGTHPDGEAAAAVAAIRRGADCFVIDAEGQYEGRYAAAQTYMTALRAGVGPDYPLALTSFPYVDYHPSLPYSVFLGPGGAQANAPQVYWKDIGGTVDAVSARTFAQNRPYTRPIVPLGQTYQKPAATELQRFRQVWSSYGAGGLSWWDWQETTPAAFGTLASPAPAPVALTDPGWPLLRKGSKGDQVVWLQEHLVSTDPTVKVTGTYDAATVTAVTAVQTAHGFLATGEMDAPTWQTVLQQPVTPVDWTTRAAPRMAPAAGTASLRATRGLPSPGIRRSEIPTVGAGGGG
ncbi:peptidoglycan-binding protein [Paraconexibacter antarcticus]|uniref:Peptidoglycan-binding protein n=1 Tax=Paraconexibacter antarcticus TaxID=2949664 RepID=A0ABY5DQM6_9ACTN|nr:peptidoglycan-binding protein [Paraconexibacter antarcticus]UTI63538.1 peptidoglycan-binding protein [Paraconexibacter antarcticus]